MNQLRQLIACEIRLHLKKRFLWLWGIFIIVTADVPTLTVLLFQFVAANIITRDEKNGFSNIMASLPYPTYILQISRAITAFCLLFALCPFMLLVIGFPEELKPSAWQFDGLQIFFLLLKYMTSCITSIGLVFLLSGITKRLLWLHLLIVGCWYESIGLASNISFLPLWGVLAVFGQGIMLPRSPSAELGFFPQQNLLLGCAAFQIALAILFLLVSIVFQMIKRREPLFSAKPVMLLAVLAMVTGGISGQWVYKELYQRTENFRAALQETSGQKVSAIDSERANEPQLEAYHLYVQLCTAEHKLSGTAEMKLKLTEPTSDILYFTLRNCFAVTNVTIPGWDEQPEWWQDGTWLAVRLPPKYRQGDSISLAIAYSGKVWEWFNSGLARPLGPVNFVDPSFSLLRSGFAWYPVPGKQLLYSRLKYHNPLTNAEEETLWAKKVLHAAVPFEMTVDIDTQDAVISNLEKTATELLEGEYKQRYRFASLEGRDVFLVAGPYQQERRKVPGRENFVDIYSYPQHHAYNDKVLEALLGPYLFYEKLLPSPDAAQRESSSQKLFSVVEMPPFLFYTENGEPSKNLMLTSAVPVSENSFREEHSILTFINTIRANKQDIAALQLWWPEDMTETLADGNIDEGIMIYLYTIYIEKNKSKNFYEQVKQNVMNNKPAGSGEGDFTRPSLVRGDRVRDVFLTLDIIRTELGETALKEILSNLHNHHIYDGKTSAADFTQAVIKASAWASLTPEKQTEIAQRLELISEKSAAVVDQQMPFYTSFTISAYNHEEWVP